MKISLIIILTLFFLVMHNSTCYALSDKDKQALIGEKSENVEVIWEIDLDKTSCDLGGDDRCEKINYIFLDEKHVQEITLCNAKSVQNKFWSATDNDLENEIEIDEQKFLIYFNRDKTLIKLISLPKNKNRNERIVTKYYNKGYTR
jgi:protease II